MAVTLNDEQRKVLRMVVEGGKNVFFTGAAGVSCAHVLAHSSLTFVLGGRDPSSARNRQIVAASCHHRCPQAETCEGFGCRLCDCQHGDGGFKRWR